MENLRSPRFYHYLTLVTTFQKHCVQALYYGHVCVTSRLIGREMYLCIYLDIRLTPAIDLLLISIVRLKIASRQYGIPQDQIYELRTLSGSSSTLIHSQGSSMNLL